MPTYAMLAVSVAVRVAGQARSFLSKMHLISNYICYDVWVRVIVIHVF